MCIQAKAGVEMGEGGRARAERKAKKLKKSRERPLPPPHPPGSPWPILLNKGSDQGSVHASLRANFPCFTLAGLCNSQKNQEESK